MLQGHVYHNLVSSIHLTAVCKCLGTEGGCCWTSLSYFLFHDVPNIFSWWKIWSADRLFQHSDSYITKPCCCNISGMLFNTVLQKYERPFLKKWRLFCSICCTDDAFLHLQSAISTCTNAPLYHQRCRLNNKNGLSPAPVVWMMWHSYFPKNMRYFDLSDHRTVSLFASVHFKLALGHRRWQHLWIMKFI